MSQAINLVGFESVKIFALVLCCRAVDGQCGGAMLQLPVLAGSRGTAGREVLPQPFCSCKVRGDRRSPSTIQRHLWLPALVCPHTCPALPIPNPPWAAAVPSRKERGVFCEQIDVFFMVLYWCLVCIQQEKFPAVTFLPAFLFNCS